MLTCLLAESGSAQQSVSGDFYVTPDLLSASVIAAGTPAARPDFSIPQPERIDLLYQAAGVKRSPVKAAALSLLLPGAGQLYAGSAWKALGFFTTEVAMWFGHTHFNSEGDKIDAEFRAYADLHWIRDNYIDWLDSLPESERERLSHTLPEKKTQQYYEMIGKYRQFLAGWPDSDGIIESPMRLSYMARQNDSNVEYKRAELLVNLMVLNRVVSAAEAVISINRRNSRIRTDLSMRYGPDGSELIPVAEISVVW
ncbi:DUF5683 domain-containing protein [candidate division KSB1 bacterium]